MIEILKTLKLRRRNLRRRIREEQKELTRYDHKSRRVRRQAHSMSMSGWYTDREQELSLVISFLEGKIEKKNFVKWLAGDEADKTLRAIGKIGMGS